MQSVASKYSAIKSGDYDKFDSKCDQTMVGHVLAENTKNTMKDYEAQCFYGVQTLKYNIESSKLVKQAHDQEFNQILKHESKANYDLK